MTQVTASMRRMDQPSDLPPAPRDGAAADAVPPAWGDLLEEMRTLHAKLEYLRLMLRVGGPLPPV